jgi:hypothetical protein
MRMFHTEKQSCPVCLRELDAAAATCDNAKAGEGPGAETDEQISLSVCIGCGAMLVWDREGKLRQLATRRFKELPASARDELLRSQLKIRAFNAYQRGLRDGRARGKA